MRKPAKFFSSAASVAVLIGSMSISATTALAAEEGAMPTPADEGKEIAFDRKKGNCLACHAIEGGVSPGTIGPPLIAMKQRFPDRKRLEGQLFDATQFNPQSPMPPYGRYHILSKDEINKVIEFLYTL